MTETAVCEDVKMDAKDYRVHLKLREKTFYMKNNGFSHKEAEELKANARTWYEYLDVTNPYGDIWVLRTDSNQDELIREYLHQITRNIYKRGARR